MKQRLAAFTLMEMMVVLAITGVVVSLSYYGFRLIQLQYRQFNQQQSQIADARRCLSLLQHDVFQAHYLLAENQNITVFQEQDTVLYDLSDEQVIRQYGSQHQDTFAVHIKIDGPQQRIDPRLALIDQLRLEIALSDFPKVLVLEKNYSAEELIRWEDEH